MTQADVRSHLQQSKGCGGEVQRATTRERGAHDGVMSVLTHTEDEAKVNKAEECSRLANAWELAASGTQYVPSKEGREYVLVTYSCITNTSKVLCIWS